MLQNGIQLERKKNELINLMGKRVEQEKII